MKTFTFQKDFLVDRAEDLIIEIDADRSAENREKAKKALRGKYWSLWRWLLRRPQRVPAADEITNEAATLENDRFGAQRNKLQCFIRVAPHVVETTVELNEADLSTFGFGQPPFPTP